MRTFLTIGLSGMLALGMTGIAVAQENVPQPPTAKQELQRIHGPRSIDQELDHLTKDLELTPKQRKQIRPLLEEHHNKIQALLDKNPTLSREALAPQIHAISHETHQEIETLLTERQKQLAKAMQKRMHDGEESSIEVLENAERQRGASSSSKAFGCTLPEMTTTGHAG
jgi:Spy/CpxP family protein refolding chaperone